ncbi:MAG: ATP-binding protein [Candidatus Thorarchaeota archaeon]
MGERDPNMVPNNQPDDLIPLISEEVLPYHPLVFDPLQLIVDPELGVIIGRTKSHHATYGAKGLGLIGAITETHEDLLESLYRTPVHLDLSDPHVLFVAGIRGSGKSYTMGVIVEEIARAMTRSEIEVAVVVVDTVDVFRQMVEPNTEQSDLLRKWGLSPAPFPANIYIPKKVYDRLPADVIKQGHLFPLSISPRYLSPSDWAFVMEKSGKLSTTMENLLGEVIESLTRGYTLDDGERVPPNPDYSIGDMMRCIRMNPALDEFYKKATRIALIQRLRSAIRYGVFSPGGVSAEDLAVPGQITIIDVAPIGDDADRVLAILTNLLCRQILRARMEWTPDGSSARDLLPPTWLVVDEAHTLVPRSGSTPAKDAIISYTKLGRRFGCSLVLATQQPSAVADEAISQADLLVSHALSYETDITALQKRAPAVMPEIFRDKSFISSLPRGVALVFDQTTENKRGFMIQVRPRLSRHGGDDRLSFLFAEPAPPGVEEVLDDEVPLEDLSFEEDEAEEAAEVPEQVEEEPPAPPEFPSEPVEPSTSPESRSSSTAKRPSIDFSALESHEFGPMPQDLLAKAAIRQLLYSPIPHNFLFEIGAKTHEEITICREGTDPLTLATDVIQQIVAFGLRMDGLVHRHGFSFVLSSNEELRVAVTVVHTSRRFCVAVVMVGPRKAINALIQRLDE